MNKNSIKRKQKNMQLRNHFSPLGIEFLETEQDAFMQFREIVFQISYLLFCLIPGVLNLRYITASYEVVINKYKNKIKYKKKTFVYNYKFIMQKITPN